MQTTSHNPILNLRTAALLVVGAVSIFGIVTQKSALDKLETRECIKIGSHNGWSETDCRSSQATYQIGAPCDYMIDLASPPDKETVCAHLAK